MARIGLEGLRKVFPGERVALESLTLHVEDGELVVVVGPSGCGKSTALRLVAGLESPSAGRVLLDGRDVTRLPPQRRDLAMVFQSYALYPHKTVAENLAFPLRMRRMGRGEITRRVLAVAHTLGLEDCLDLRPRALSGGQRQRVALGRAIVREPAAFLLDEPLSNLDAQLRRGMRAELARLKQRLGATMLLVTHDQEEAMTLGERIVVMRTGRVEQSGPPREVYAQPASRFVAEFIGSPAVNVIRCRCARAGGGVRLEAPGLRLELPTAPVGDAEAVDLAVRPEDLEVTDAAAADLAAQVEVVEALGHATVLHVGSRAGGLRVLLAGARAPAGGSTLHLRVRRPAVHLFDPATGRRMA
jgi:multiple sugar transport system ATP-binding protein